MTPVQVEELNLDNVCAAQISGLSQGFTSLKHLSIINTGLTTLDSFPAMHALERVGDCVTIKHVCLHVHKSHINTLTHPTQLELSDNKLSNDLKVLSGCPSLRHLSLAGNRITSLETLKPLVSWSQSLVISFSKNVNICVELLPSIEALTQTFDGHTYIWL